MRALFTIISLLIILSVYTSCNKEEERDPLLKGWQMTRIEKKDSDPPLFLDKPEDLPIKVYFSSYGVVTVKSYCNEGSANFSFRGASLEIIGFHMTEKACQTNEPLDWEAIFAYNFELSEYYLVEDGNLIILTGGDYHLHFEPLQ